MSFGGADTSDDGKGSQTDSGLIFASVAFKLPGGCFPGVAENDGAALVIINRGPTGLDRIADLVLNRAIGETLGAAVRVD